MRRVLIALCALALAVGFAPLVAAPAQALQAPVAFTSDDLSTWQTNDIAWAVAEASGLVFVGGDFTSVRPPGAAAGTGEVTRNHLAVFDAATGAPTSCAPSVTLPSAPGSATVRTLTVSPDKSTLYVGGYFSTVAGYAQQHLAAIDISSCTFVTSFRPLPVGIVRALDATSSVVYFTGLIASVAGADRDYAGAVRAVGTSTPGSLLPWAPVLNNEGRAIAVSPDESVVVLGGNFTTINGAASRALAVVDASTGATVKAFGSSFIPTNSVTKALAVDATGFYAGNEGSGGGVFDGRLAVDWGTYNQRWRDTCLGATQAVTLYQDVLYAGHHAHNCTSMGAFPDGSRHHLTAQSVNSPTLLPWFPDTNDGLGEQIGPRGMVAAGTGPGNDYMWVVGEFTTVNGVAQQGVTRFGQGVDTVAPSTPTVSATSFRTGQARIAWRQSLDTDDALLTYEVFRDNGTTPVHTESASSWFWSRQQMTFVDTNLAPGSTHTYRVSVSDGTNTVLTSWRSVTVASISSNYAERVVSDGASSLWRYDEPSDVFLSDSINNNNVTLRGATTYQVAPAAIAGDSSRALTLGGTANAWRENRVAAPTSYSVETWVKTSTTAGGKILGFGDKQDFASSTYDKHLYMTNNGRLFYGVYNGSYITLQSTASYNDNVWHHVVATQGSGGMALYVDGVRIAKNSVTTSQTNAGYWKLGGDTLSGSWPSSPSSDYFGGSVDETAIYPAPLSASTVAEHFALAGGTPSASAVGPADYYGKSTFQSDPSVYWRLNEASGGTAADTSGNGSTGTYFSGVTYNQTGAVAGTTDKAVTLNGASTGLVASNASAASPSTYSAEIWFKTTTGSGGKILGYGSSKSGNSSSYDRHVYMRNDGRLTFGVNPGSIVTVTSPSAYNNGAWHYLVATQGPSGMGLYVDGVLVGSNAQTGNQSYTGYWRVGGDQISSSWPSNPSTNYFNGTVDEFVVRSGALTAAQVAARYSAGNLAPIDTAAPTTPVQVAAGFSAGDAQLSWPASLDNVGVTGYDVYRSATLGFTPSALTLVASPGSASWTDSGVLPGTWYYRVIAKDAAGNRSAASNQVSVFVTDVSPPTMPAGVTVTTTSTSASLSWAASTDNVGVVGYNVYRSASSGFTPGAANLLTTVVTTNFLDTPLPQGSWYYRIAARDGAGNVGTASAQVIAGVADGAAPTVPGGLATAVGGSSVTLTWTASTDDVGVTGYDVYRSATSGFIPAAATLIGSPTGASFVSAVPAAGTWYFQVIAKDAAGNRSAASLEVPAVVSAFGATITLNPTADAYANQSAATTNFGTSSSLSSRGGPSVVSYLRFAPPAAPVGTNLTGAVLRIRTTSDSSAGSVGSHGITLASDAWTESAMNWNNRPALTGGSIGAFSTATAANTVYQTSLTPSGLASWAGSQGTLAVSSTSTDTLWFWSSNHANTTYRPQLVLTYSPPDTTPPSVPSGVVATATGSSVGLTWSASSDDTAVAGYDIHRGTSAGFAVSGSTLVGTSATTAFTDAPVGAGAVYYRVVARDAVPNSSAGSPAVPVTVPDVTAPSAPSAPAGTTTSTSATLTWTPSVDNVGVVEYEVHRSATSGFVSDPSNVVATVADTEFVESPLALGTWYYVVRAKDAAGNTSSPSLQVSVVLVDISAPTMPVGVVAGVLGAGVSLSWADASDDVGVTGYDVYRSDSAGFTPGPANLLTSVTDANYLDTPVTPGTWHYRVVAKDASGNLSDPSDEASVSASDITAPSTPTDVVTTVVGAEVGVSWSASTDDVGVMSYQVYRSADPGFVPDGATLVGTVAGTNYLDNPVGPGTWYYVVIAEDGASNRSLPSIEVAAIVVDGVVPSVPTDVTAVPSDPAVGISWTASTDDIGVTGYDVYRSNASSFTPSGATLVGSVGSSPYIDTPVPPGTWYYRVVAKDAAGNRSVASDEVVASVSDVTAPSVPAGLSAVADVAAIGLSWSPSTDDGVVTGYDIYRSTTAGFTADVTTYVATVTDPSYIDTPLAPGAWHYRVIAVDAAANRSEASAEVTATVLDADPPSAPSDLVATVTSPSVQVSWSASTDNVGVTGYDVYRSTSAGFTPGPSNLVGSSVGASFADPSVPAGTSYYRVIAKDAEGNRSVASGQVSALVLDISAPSDPTGVAVTVTGTTVGLTWTASTDNVGVTGYDVYRSVTAGFTPGPATLVGSSATATFTNSSVPAGTWYYRVVAKDAAGNRSSGSAEVSALVVVAPTVVSLTPTADTYANQGAAATNFGTSSSLTARTTAPGATSHLRFVIPAAPANTTLISAVLRIRTNTDPSSGTVEVPNIQVGSDAWTESTLTWNNRPSITAGSIGVFPAGSATNTVYNASLNVASLQALIGTQATLAVTSPGSDSLWFWSSNHANTSYRPQLTLTYASGDVTPPSVPSALTADPAGTSAALTWNPSTDSSGVAGYDVYRSAATGFTPGPATLVGSVSGTSFTDLSVAAGTWYYRVRARDSAANASAGSSEVPAVLSGVAPAMCGFKAGPSAVTKTMTVWFENRDYADVIGNANAPKITAAAASCGLATNYTSQTHPSLPNYLTAVSGVSYATVPWINSCAASDAACRTDNVSIFEQVGASRWKAYAESMPSNCSRSDSNPYAVRHNPAAYFNNISAACTTRDVPLGTTAAGALRDDLAAGTLADHVTVVPNQNNNMHDGTVTTGDTWVSEWLALVTVSPDYRSGKLAVILAWDEGTGSGTNVTSHVPAVVLSAYTAPGTTSATAYDHNSLLRTTEEIAGVPLLGDAVTAPSMRSAFGL